MKLNSRFVNGVKQGFTLFCLIFAVTTLISSALQLFQNQLTDTNFHILNRAGIVLIAVITIKLFDGIRLKSKVLSYLVPYAISMGIVFLYVWLTGFIEPLHPDAYRDIFLNFTAVAIVLMLIFFVKDRWMARKSVQK